jgi:hypothetical protein
VAIERRVLTWAVEIGGKTAIAVTLIAATNKKDRRAIGLIIWTPPQTEWP